MSVVRILSSHTDVNVPGGPLLESVTILISRLVLMVMLCPMTVIGVALLTAVPDSVNYVVTLEFFHKSGLRGMEPSVLSSMCIGICNYTRTVFRIFTFHRRREHRPHVSVELSY